MGGKKLAKRRHNLDAEPAITHKEWLTLWRMARLFLVADGEPNVIGGNQGIRVLPDDRAGAEPDTYKIVMRLPIGLEHLSNTAAREPTFVFSAAIVWKNQTSSPAVEPQNAVAAICRLSDQICGWAVAYFGFCGTRATTREDDVSGLSAGWECVKRGF